MSIDEYNIHKCGALRDFVPFVQFKKPEKHPSRSVTFKLLLNFFFRVLGLTSI